MPTIIGQTSVAANASSNNLLDDDSQPLRFMPLDAIGVCRVFMTSSAAGLNAGFSVSGRQELYQSPTSTQNRAPLDPDDLVLDGVVANVNEELQLPVLNTTAGALTLFYRIDITYTPIA